MTYAEIACARGISAHSAERLVRRRRWPKQLGNDGTVRVLVPADEARPASARSEASGADDPGEHPAVRPAGCPPRYPGSFREVIRPLSEQFRPRISVLKRRGAGRSRTRPR